MSFPRAQFVRCLWHLSHLVADLGPADVRSALRRGSRHVLRAPSWDAALTRYQRFRATWLERAPESCRALAEGLEEAMSPLPSAARRRGMEEKTPPPPPKAGVDEPFAQAALNRGVHFMRLGALVAAVHSESDIQDTLAAFEAALADLNGDGVL